MTAEPEASGLLNASQVIPFCSQEWKSMLQWGWGCISWKCPSVLFFFFFGKPFVESLLNLLQYGFCFMFWFFGHEACGVLVLPSGIEHCTFCIGRSLQDWTAREVPSPSPVFFCTLITTVLRHQCGRCILFFLKRSWLQDLLHCWNGTLSSL